MSLLKPNKCLYVPWKTITVQEITKSDIALFNSIGFYVHSNANRAKSYLEGVDQSCRGDIGKRVDLYKFRVRQLGFRRRAGVSRVFKRAEELGFKYCNPPISVLLALDLQKLRSKFFWHLPFNGEFDIYAFVSSQVFNHKGNRGWHARITQYDLAYDPSAELIFTR